MKSFNHPSKVAAKATRNTIQKKSHHAKVMVDNRPESVIQRQMLSKITSGRVLREMPAKGGLPANLKLGLEEISGYSLDDVRVHYNSSKPAEVGAFAYAQGNDIYLGPGQEKHLAHEAWHVVQQKQGKVKPTLQQVGGVNVNDNYGLEKEADRMGEKALKFTAAHQSINAYSPNLLVIKQENHNIPNYHFSGIIQRRKFQATEKENLENYIKTAKEIETDYNKTKEEIKAIESVLFCPVTKLNEIHSKIEEVFAEYDNYFSELNEKKKQAHITDENYISFKVKLNWFTQAGGKNKLKNLEKYIKKIPKENAKSIAIPSVTRSSDYLILIKKLREQAFLHCKEMCPLQNIDDLMSDLSNLINKVEVNNFNDWDSITSLHNKISKALESYPTWKSAIKEQFMEFKLVSSKKVPTKLLHDIGSINVASRSDKSEGYYMRSQNVHKMHIGNGEVNPFAERTETFLSEDAKIYNIGGAKTIADIVMTQKEPRRGRKKVSSKEFEALRDDILEHKNECVKYIVNTLGPITHFEVPVAQLDAKYPCVLILFGDDLMNKIKESQDNIPEFMTHLLAGHINAALVNNSLRPLIDRRQSFGFMTPTITDVHSGVRLSLGITPSKAWCQAVIQGIKAADKNIDSFQGYKSVDKKTDNDLVLADVNVVMNKFNNGLVLGAGHKLITDTLLSENNKDSITTRELNEIFGKKSGLDVVNSIQEIKKRNFDGQDVDKDSEVLYNRLKALYEQFIKVSGGQVEIETVDWKTVDPAKELQRLLDKGVEAAYNDIRNVVGLDESSDEEDRDQSRIPSGMSALFLPIAAYSSMHTDRSIVYDTAPFSYFEIDGSWKRTFKLDRIERIGIRYPIVTSNVEKEALQNFDQCAEQEIKNQTEPLRQEIDEIKNKGMAEEDLIRSQYNNSLAKLKRDGKPIEDLKNQGSKVEKKIDKMNAVINDEVNKKKLEIDKLTTNLKEGHDIQKNSLVTKLTELTTIMSNYMACKEAYLDNANDQTSEKLHSSIEALKELITKYQMPGIEGKLVTKSILDSFNKIGFEEMDKGVNAKLESNVEVTFIDVNPCMTSKKNFDSGENLYHQAMKKYDNLKMVVADITSSTENQVKDLIALFQNQKDDRSGQGIVPFLCLAKSGTKHDQLGLDISTMGRCHYVMHNSFADNEQMLKEFRNLSRASRRLSKNTEPALVKKMRRDLRKAAQNSVFQK